MSDPQAEADHGARQHVGHHHAAVQRRRHDEGRMEPHPEIDDSGSRTSALGWVISVLVIVLIFVLIVVGHVTGVMPKGLHGGAH